MEFWSAEVQNGQTLDVIVPKEYHAVQLSLASLGEIKEEIEESVCLEITVDSKKIVVGSLHPTRQPHRSLRFLFNKNFQISHTRKHGSVFFYGHKASYKMRVSKRVKEEESPQKLQSEKSRPKKTHSTEKTEGKEAEGNSVQKRPASDDAPYLKSCNRNKRQKMSSSHKQKHIS